MTDLALLRDLTAAQADGPHRLDELARKLGIGPSLLVRRLRPLVDAGLVERREARTEKGREVVYLPRAALRVEWVSPARGIALSWTLADEPDWSAPLASQIGDAAARAAISRFIGGLRAGRRVRPKSAPPDSDDFAEPALVLIVFGSVVTGRSRPDSDIDVLAITDAPGDEEEILDVAADVTALSERPLQVKVIPRSRLARLPVAIEQAIQREGVIVFDGLHDAALWRRVYGGRT